MNQETAIQTVVGYLENYSRESGRNFDFELYMETEEGHPVLAADWNRMPDEKVDQIERILDKVDSELGWIDEWNYCYDCYKGLRTSPTCWSWTPNYIHDIEGYLICKECFKDNPEAYLEMYEDNPYVALPNWADLTLLELGYRKYFDEDCETGFHPGQNDSPEKVAEELREKGIYNFVFVIEATGQFDTDWNVYVKEEEA